MLKIFGSHDENTLKQMETCMAHPAAVAGVLCADGHLGYGHPIGGVVAYQDHVSLSGVGFDIGCGNMAVKTDVPWSTLAPRAGAIAGDIANTISFGVGRKNNERVEHPLLDNDTLWKLSGLDEFRTLARDQLGTVGSGNHYVDLFEDDDGFTWIGVHFGSRGFGHKVASHFLKLCGAKDGMMVEPCVLSTENALGLQYLRAMTLAGDYASAGREWVVNKVLGIIDGYVLDEVHNHHNYAWFENGLWVVRKGATPAFPGQRGFVGGSMGDAAVILEGVAGEASEEALHSTVHGAGRVMSRTQARGKVHKKTGEVKQEPQITREAMNAWLKATGVLRIGGDVDEAPQAYRRLSEVLKAHEGTINVQHVLQPRVVLMAGSDDFDPYKD